MEVTKTFKVIDGSIRPPRSLDSMNFVYDCSDTYFAKVITIGDNERYFIVRYDFRYSKWKSPMAGLKLVIEYYIEINE